MNTQHTINTLDGLDELILRLEPDDVLPWFERHGSGSPGDARMFGRWLATRRHAEAVQVENDLRRRLFVLVGLAHGASPARADRADSRDGAVQTGEAGKGVPRAEGPPSR